MSKLRARMEARKAKRSAATLPYASEYSPFIAAEASVPLPASSIKFSGAGGASSAASSHVMSGRNSGRGASYRSRASPRVARGPSPPHTHYSSSGAHTTVSSSKNGTDDSIHARVDELTKKLSGLANQLTKAQRKNCALEQENRSLQQTNQDLSHEATSLRDENEFLLAERSHYMQELTLEHDSLQTLFKEAKAMRIALAGDAEAAGCVVEEPTYDTVPRRPSLMPPPPPPNPPFPPLERDESLLDVFERDEEGSPIPKVKDGGKKSASLERAIAAAIAQSRRLASPGN